MARAWRIYAGNEVEHCGLSRSVGSDYAQDLFFHKLKAEIVDRPESTEVLGYILEFEYGAIAL